VANSWQRLPAENHIDVILLDPRSTSEFNTHEKHQPPRAC
jgi:hypothetical protein